MTTGAAHQPKLLRPQRRESSLQFGATAFNASMPGLTQLKSKAAPDWPTNTRTKPQPQQANKVIADDSTGGLEEDAHTHIGETP